MAGIYTLLKTGFATDHYYKSMNQALKKLNEEYTMLHYPYFQNEGESFHTAQKNLTDFCVSCLPSMEGKQVLEIGCGNGNQAKYMLQKYAPASITAIDLSEANIKIAKSEAKRLNVKNIQFEVGDAQALVNIKDQSVDLVINIESAFHYPDKSAFLNEISRVLKPGGYFLIADILATPGNGNPLKKIWNRKMNFHHWSQPSYEAGLSDARLQIESTSEITDQVIQGFQMYRYWLKSMKKGRYFGDLALKSFYIINARINIMLLRKHQQYIVFSGKAA